MRSVASPSPQNDLAALNPTALIHRTRITNIHNYQTTTITEMHNKSPLLPSISTYPPPLSPDRTPAWITTPLQKYATPPSATYSHHTHPPNRKFASYPQHHPLSAPNLQKWRVGWPENSRSRPSRVGGIRGQKGLVLLPPSGILLAISLTILVVVRMRYDNLHQGEAL